MYAIYRELTVIGVDDKQKQDQCAPKVVDKVAHFIPYQDILSIDWNLEDFAARVKKTNSGVFAVSGKGISILILVFEWL